MTEYNFGKLNRVEKEFILPILIEELRWRKGAKNAISNPTLVEMFHEKGYDKVTEVTIKMMIFHLRNYDKTFDFLIANSFGHFISDDFNEITNWINTHDGKICAMGFTLNNMKHALNTKAKKLKKTNREKQLSISFTANKSKEVKVKKQKNKITVNIQTQFSIWDDIQ